MQPFLTSKKLLFPFGFLLFISTSCKKDWLNEKTNKSTVVPTTISDFKALLNKDGNNLTPLGLSDIAAGEFTIPEESWNNVGVMEKSTYIWKTDYYNPYPSVDWKAGYESVFYANVVLEGISSIKTDNSNIVAWNNLKGWALFLRSYIFYCLCQQYTSPYDSNTAGSSLGIPLRLNTDITQVSVRSSLSDNYNEIIKSLQEAINFLPVAPEYKTNPSKAAAYGLLARVYLSMREYDKSGIYADSALMQYNRLLDYNDLDPTANFPIPPLNSEVIYGSDIPLTATAPYADMSPELYDMYSDHDLRKKVFFVKDATDIIRFKGSYRGMDVLFGGIATDEIYLIRAECMARKNKITEALQDLNMLLQKRYENGFFTPVTALTVDQALSIILQEREKELIRRGIRWSDLRRLNKESRFAKELDRTIGSETYTLPPNDPRFALPIPPDVIKQTDMPQNEY